MPTKITISTFTPIKEPNPYAEVITKLAEAGPDAAANMDVDKASAPKMGRKFADAANDAGYTAKKRVTLAKDDDGEFTIVLDKEALEALADDAIIRIVYTLGPKQNRPGRPRKDAAANAVEIENNTPAPKPNGNRRK